MVRNIFAMDEVLKLAVRIEVNGMEFYYKMVEKVKLEGAKPRIPTPRQGGAWVKDNKLKNLLNFLGREEEKHRKIFQEILDNLGEEEVVETYPGEYKAYLKALAGECIFTPLEINSENNTLRKHLWCFLSLTGLIAWEGFKAPSNF